MIVVAGESLVDLLVDEGGAVDARLGGGPFNVARGLARLEVPCAFLGAISTDRFGRMLRQALVDDGVDLRCVVETGAPTTLALAYLSHGSATYAFYTAGTAAPALTDADAAAVVPDEIEALHVGTLGLALEPMASALERLVLRVADATLVMVDPNVRSDMLVDDEQAYRARLGRVLERADVVKVSTEDLAHLWPGEDVVPAARRLLSGRTRCVLVTAGADAVHVLTEAGELEIGTVPVRVADTVGAGDAFCAGFLSRWRREGHKVADLSDVHAAGRAATFAALVAGITCQRVGADPPRLGEIPGASVLSW
jgi:fructokinase